MVSSSEGNPQNLGKLPVREMGQVEQAFKDTALVIIAIKPGQEKHMQSLLEAEGFSHYLYDEKLFWGEGLPPFSQSYLDKLTRDL